MFSIGKQVLLLTVLMATLSASALAQGFAATISAESVEGIVLLDGPTIITNPRPLPPNVEPDLCRNRRSLRGPCECLERSSDGTCLREDTFPNKLQDLKDSLQNCGLPLSEYCADKCSEAADELESWLDELYEAITRADYLIAQGRLRCPAEGGIPSVGYCRWSGNEDFSELLNDRDSVLGSCGWDENYDPYELLTFPDSYDDALRQSGYQPCLQCASE